MCLCLENTAGSSWDLRSEAQPGEVLPPLASHIPAQPLPKSCPFRLYKPVSSSMGIIMAPASQGSCED